MGSASADTPGKMDEKLKSENMQKRAVFFCLCYILRATRAGRCKERRCADHIFIKIYFRMHHFVVKFSESFIASGGKGALTPLTKILRTFRRRSYDGVEVAADVDTRHGTGSLGHRVNGSFGSSFTSGTPGHHYDPA